MKSLAQEFKDARVQSGLSQRDLAMATGVMQCTISRYESGKQDITLETAIRLAKKIGNNGLLKKIGKHIQEQLKIN